MRSLSFVGGLAAALTCAPALAQQPGDFDVWPDILLGPNNNGSGYMVNGVGSPTVAYDTDQGRYLMAFEVRLPNGHPDCPADRWALGLAFSDDGVSDWQTTTIPIVKPQMGTYFACIAAHPTILYNSANRTALIWFKAEQTMPVDPDIGPHRYTGVGLVRVRFRADGSIEQVLVSPEPALRVDAPFNNPRVVRYKNELHMALALWPDMWTARGTSPTDFQLSDGPELVASDANPGWAVDELFNASLVCENDLLFPFSIFLGGRTFDATGSISVGGWGRAVSANDRGWYLGATPYFQWRGQHAWRHWDVLRVDDQSGTHYLVYFDEKDDQGRNQVRLASTLPAWNPHDVYSKYCW